MSATHPPLSRLNIIQSMQAILEQPASPELAAFITQEEAKTPDPLLKAFLRLLSTDNAVNRAKAMEAFKVLEKRYHADQVRTVAAETISELTASTVAPREDPYAAAREAASRAEAILQATAQEETPPPAPSAEVLPFQPRQRITVTLPENDPDPKATVAKMMAAYDGKFRPSAKVPYVDGALESVRFKLATTQEEVEGAPERVYSIISQGHQPARFLTAVTGLVIGVARQLVVEHGFGFVLPLGGQAIALHPTDPVDIKIALEYPQALAIYDDHQGYRLPGVDRFFALHNALAAGYRFLLDLRIIPINGSYVLSIQSHCCIERKASEDRPALVSSADLEQLAFAAKSLSFVGFLADSEAPFH